MYFHKLIRKYTINVSQKETWVEIYSFLISNRTISGLHKNLSGGVIVPIPEEISLIRVSNSMHIR